MEALDQLINFTGETTPFEIADAIVNWGGYADDPQLIEEKADLRDMLEVFLGGFLYDDVQ